MLNYYARAEEPAEGGSSLTARIQLAGAPYTSVLDMTSKISGEWKSYCALPRRQRRALPEKKSSVSIHLATAKQVIDLGPVLVFNFGKGYDTKKLSVLRWLSRTRARFRRRCASCASRSRTPRSSSRMARLTIARAEGARVFAVFALNHHGDGHVALWLNTPALEQSRLHRVRAEAHLQAAIRRALGLDRRRAQSRVFLEARDRARAHGLRATARPQNSWRRLTRRRRSPAPTAKMKPAEIDRLQGTEGAQASRADS
mgnify:CR=1 FL=1